MQPSSSPAAPATPQLQSPRSSIHGDHDLEVPPVGLPPVPPTRPVVPLALPPSVAVPLAPEPAAGAAEAVAVSAAQVFEWACLRVLTLLVELIHEEALPPSHLPPIMQAVMQALATLAGGEGPGACETAVGMILGEEGRGLKLLR